MKIRAVETGLLHEERRMDRRTDMTKLIVAFRNFVKVLNNVRHFFYVRKCLISVTEKSVNFLITATEKFVCHTYHKTVTCLK
jgi:hypothetical protein